MKSKLLLIPVLILSLLIISACSSSKDKEMEEVNQESAKVIDDFTKKFNSVMTQSNDLLSSFNTALDGLYTNKVSLEQFSTIMKTNIDQSRELNNTVDKYDINPYTTVYRQNLIGYLNSQHQLFLNAMQMINAESIDANSLRQTYLEVKTAKSDLEYKYFYGEGEQQ